MKWTARLRTWILLPTCFGLLVPSPVFATSAPPAETKVEASTVAVKTLDVALHNSGTLVGQVVDTEGKPQPKMPVTLVRGNEVLAQTVTNNEGHFAMKQVPAGSYRLAAGDAQNAYRLWAPKTAPPTARQGALMVVGEATERAQCGANGPLGQVLGNPWVIGGIVAAAIAIPVAIHNHNKDKSPKSP